MLFKSSKQLLSFRLPNPQILNHFHFNQVFKTSPQFSIQNNMYCSSSQVYGLGIPKKNIFSNNLYSFSTYSNNNELQTNQDPRQDEQQKISQLTQELVSLITQTSAIKSGRINKKINDEIQKQLLKSQKNILKNFNNIQKADQWIKKEKNRIQTKIREDVQYTESIQMQEHKRAMIMVRLSTLWNQKYEQLSIDCLLKLSQQFQSIKQLNANQFKFITMLFLAVQIVKKCIKSPRIHKNILCQTKSISQNIQSVRQSIRGQMQARVNLQKTEKMVSNLLISFNNTQNRLSFMKTQYLIQFLISEIVRSFHQPELYNDKSACLTSNPPRVVFDQPFHQQYDRFIEMAVLILFDKRLKKQAKSSKLQYVKSIFQKIKIYEQNKLQQTYRKQQNSLVSIKKIKKNLNKMDKRVHIVKWIQDLVTNKQKK